MEHKLENEEIAQSDTTNSVLRAWTTPRLTVMDIAKVTLTNAGSGPDGGGSSSHS